jgi:pyroglutamyl-peptidase
MKLLVTAFGPFGGRPHNASALALAGLKERLPWINTRILPVDVAIAPMRMSRALREVRPDAVMMLGEAGGSTAIRLETTAWNELDFRIPDNAGRQPRGLRIDERAPDSLASTLPFETIHEALSAEGHEVEFSDDPGRYLCNQILFHTLRRMDVSRSGARAGFVHLPWETDYPTARAVDALGLVVAVITGGR